MNPSTLKRSFPGPWTVVAVLPVLLLLCPQANAASPDALTENLYARAGGGVFFLDMSESSPFIRTNNREEVVGFLDHYDAAFQAGPLVNLAVGGEYNAFGKNLFTELSGFLTFYNSKHVNDYNEDSAPWTEALTQFDRQCPLSLVDGGCPLTSETEPLLVALLNDNPDARLVGWVGKIDGDAMPFGAPNFAWGDPIRISTKRKVDFHGVDLVTGMFFRQTGRTKVALFIGPSYKRLNQESETFAYESESNLKPRDARGQQPDPERRPGSLVLRRGHRHPHRPSVQGALEFHVRRQAGSVLSGFQIRRVPENAVVLGRSGLG